MFLELLINSETTVSVSVFQNVMSPLPSTASLSKLGMRVRAEDFESINCNLYPPNMRVKGSEADHQEMYTLSTGQCCIYFKTACCADSVSRA